MIVPVPFPGETLLARYFIVPGRYAKQRLDSLVHPCLRTCAVAMLTTLTAVSGPAQVIHTRGTQFDIDIAGNVYVLDTDRNALALYDRAAAVQQVVGGSGWLDGQFDRPSAVWARNGIDVFVADYGNHRIQRFDRALSFVSSLSTRENSNPDERFGYPTDIALSRMGELFICDTENGRIVKVDRSNKVERSFGGFGAGKGRLNAPTRLEIGPKDAIYVLDGKRIAVFDAFGNYLRDFMPGLLNSSAELYGDPARLIVLEGDTVYCFDAEERPAGTFTLNVAAPGVRGVRAMAAQGAALWLLATGGVYALPDAFPAGDAKKP